MNKTFMLFDKNNNLQKTANVVVKFNFEGKDYLVYSVEENEQNSQIFVSRLILNSEGKHFIDNILPEEKGKLNNIVYNIVILIPSEAQKGSTYDALTSDLYNKFSVKLLPGFSDMETQEYYSNCSVAITSKVLVDSAVKFYFENLNNNSGDNPTLVPTWTSPVEVTAPVPAAEPANVPEPVVTSTVNVPAAESVVVPEVNLQPIVNESVTPISVSSEPVLEKPATELNIQPEKVEAVLPVSEPVVTPVVDNSPVQVNNNNNLPNPQVEKLAVVSDPSLGIGVTQPNVVKNKKAGYANTKYIVIGSACLFLAVAVVITAYFLITNMA